ncbi:MAG: TonB-dependent receptor [Robiginitomaculum sp.]|nr:TonB-dependent receptor [Robiginitomaculum sp.]
MFNKKYGKKYGLLASTALIASVAFSGVAHAQIDEIIVTATKRTQTLQETPVTVSVTTSDVLDKAQILDIQDLQSVVPSLRVGQLQSSANVNFRIRGFGNGANNAGIEPSVGVFIDGVYRSRSAAQIGDLPKLERVEVLSGPQSTLFGKNSSAGVISVVTAKPSFESQGYIEGGLGNFNQRVLRAYATGGLSDTIALSVGGSLNKRDGYAPSAVPGLDANNSRDRFSLRGQLLFEPRDDISIRLIVDHSEIDEICCTVTNVQNGPTAGAIAAVGGALADPNDPFAFINFQNINSDNLVNDDGISLHVDVDFDNFTVTTISAVRSNQSSFLNDSDFTTANLLTINSDVDIQTFTQELRVTSTGDNKVDWMIGGYYFSESIDQLGGIDIGSDFRPFLDTLLFAQTGNPTALNDIEALFGQAPGTFFNNSAFTTDTFTQDNQAYSAFATVDFHATDKLTITGGLNFTKDQKSVTGNVSVNEVFSSIDLNADPTGLGVPLPTVLTAQDFPNITTACGLGPQSLFDPAALPALLAAPACFGPLAGLTGAQAFGVLQDGVTDGITGLQALQFLPQFVAFDNSVENGRTNDEQVTWTARLAYEVNNSVNVYASAGTGFKASSWNLSRDSRPFAADAAALGAAGLLQANQTFGTRFAGPEDVLAFEVGIKTRFDKGAFNISVFDQTVNDFQSNTFLGTGFVLGSAGQQSTFGVEFDASYYPFEALALTFAGIYLDAKYDEFINGPGPNNTVVDLSGQDVAGVPEFGFSTSATYTHDFGGGNTGYIRADYQFESEVNIVEALDVQAKTSIFNGSIGVKLDNGFGIQLWGRNIFNQESFISAFPGVVQAGTVNAYPTPPATYGVLVRKEF